MTVAVTERMTGGVPQPKPLTVKVYVPLGTQAAKLMFNVLFEVNGLAE